MTTISTFKSEIDNGTLTITRDRVSEDEYRKLYAKQDGVADKRPPRVIASVADLFKIRAEQFTPEVIASITAVSIIVPDNYDNKPELSLEGIQNLPALKSLKLHSTNVQDWGKVSLCTDLENIHISNEKQLNSLFGLKAKGMTRITSTVPSGLKMLVIDNCPLINLLMFQQFNSKVADRNGNRFGSEYIETANKRNTCIATVVCTNNDEYQLYSDYAAHGLGHTSRRLYLIDVDGKVVTLKRDVVLQAYSHWRANDNNSIYDPSKSTPKISGAEKKKAVVFESGALKADAPIAEGAEAAKPDAAPVTPAKEAKQPFVGGSSGSLKTQAEILAMVRAEERALDVVDDEVAPEVLDTSTSLMSSAMVLARSLYNSTPLRIAAAVVLTLGATFVAIRFNRSDNTHAIAQAPHTMRNATGWIEKATPPTPPIFGDEANANLAENIVEKPIVAVTNVEEKPAADSLPMSVSKQDVIVPAEQLLASNATAAPLTAVVPAEIEKVEVAALAPEKVEPKIINPSDDEEKAGLEFLKQYKQRRQILEKRIEQELTQNSDNSTAAIWR